MEGKGSLGKRTAAQEQNVLDLSNRVILLKPLIDKTGNSYGLTHTASSNYF